MRYSNVDPNTKCLCLKFYSAERFSDCPHFEITNIFQSKDGIGNKVSIQFPYMCSNTNNISATHPFWYFMNLLISPCLNTLNLAICILCMAYV